MDNFLNWITEINSRRNRTILGLLAALCYLLMYLMMTNVIGTLNVYYMMDTNIFYTGDDFLLILGGISSEQANLYQVFHYIDYLFVLSFYPLYVLILDKFVVRNKPLILLPLLAMFFDFFENIIIDIEIHRGVSKFVANIASTFTVLKFAVILVGVIILLANYYLNRKK